jgi:hypothetical protein
MHCSEKRRYRPLRLVSLVLALATASVGWANREAGSRVATESLADATARIVHGVAMPTCGDPNGDGEIDAVDALFVLNASVLLVACQKCICDVDDSGAIASLDALLLLRTAVGLPAELSCPQCPVTTTTAVTITTVEFPSTTTTTTTTVSTSTTTTTTTTTLALALLTVVPAGAGSGTVTSDDDLIDCGNECTASYDEGDTVELTATPEDCSASASRSNLAGWSISGLPSQSCASDSEDCTVSMTVSRTVTVVFDDPQCPAEDEPIDNLEKDCRDHGYFYRLNNGLGEGLATDGENIEIVQSDLINEITYQGTVTGTTTFDIDTASVNGGPATNVDNASNGNIANQGDTLNLTIVSPTTGEVFEVNGACFIGEACIESILAALRSGGARVGLAGTESSRTANGRTSFDSLVDRLSQ